MKTFTKTEKKRFTSLPDVSPLVKKHEVEREEKASKNKKSKEKRKESVKSVCHSRSFDTKMHSLFVGFKHISNRLEKLQVLVKPLVEEKKKKSSVASPKKKAIKRRKPQKVNWYYDKLRKANESEASYDAQSMQGNDSSNVSNYDTEDSVFNFSEEEMGHSKIEVSEQYHLNDEDRNNTVFPKQSKDLAFYFIIE